MPSTNRNYLARISKRVKNCVSRKIGGVLNCYVGRIAAVEILSCSSNYRFREVAARMFDSDLKGERRFFFTVCVTFRRYEKKQLSKRINLQKEFEG